MNLQPCFAIGSKGTIENVTIRGTKMKFTLTNDKFKAEFLAYGTWANLGWTHEKCLAYIEAHKTRKNGGDNFKWVYDLRLGNKVFELVSELEQIEEIPLVEAEIIEEVAANDQ